MDGPWSADIRSVPFLSLLTQLQARNKAHTGALRPRRGGLLTTRQLRGRAPSASSATRAAIRILSGALCSRSSGVWLLQARGRGLRAGLLGGVPGRRGRAAADPESWLREGLGSLGSGADFGRPRVVLAAFSFPLNHWVGAPFPTDRRWFPAGPPPPPPPPGPGRPNPSIPDATVSCGRLKFIAFPSVSPRCFQWTIPEGSR